MKLKAVVCRVTDDDGHSNEQLMNLDPESFIAMLDQATGGPGDDLAALEAELAAARGHAEPPSPKNAAPEGASHVGEMRSADGRTILLPREAVEPLVQAKTRGELIDRLNELLSPFGIQIAGA